MVINSLKILFSLSFRNILKNRKRSLISGIAVSFATMILLFFISLQLSAYRTSIDISTSVLHSHAQILNSKYEDQINFDNYFNYDLNFQEKLLDILNKSSEVVAFSPRAQSFVLISNQDRTYGSLLLGIDPETEKKVSRISNFLVNGRSILSANEINLGIKLAENLGVKIGDEVSLVAQGRNASLVAESFNVVGIIDSGIKEVDTGYSQVVLESFQKAFDIGTNVHAVAIKLNDVARVNEFDSFLEPKIQQLNEEIKIYPWQQVLPGLKQAIDLDASIATFFYFCLLLVIGFTLTNTFTMSVIERKKEFGIMQAIGMTKFNCSLMVYFEATILSLFFIIFGVIAGSGIVYYYGNVGFSIPGSEEVAIRLGMTPVIFPSVSFKSLILSVSLIYMLAILSAFFPSREPLKIKISEAIR